MSSDGTEAKLTVGQVVRAQRLRRGMSGPELAAAAGVDKATVSRIEHDEFEPTPRVLLGIARALEIDVSDLYLAAGLLPGTALPSMGPYLRAKFDLPEDALQRIEEYVEMVNERYTREGDGDDQRSTPAA